MAGASGNGGGGGFRDRVFFDYFLCGAGAIFFGERERKQGREQNREWHLELISRSDFSEGHVFSKRLISKILIVWSNPGLGGLRLRESCNFCYFLLLCK